MLKSANLQNIEHAASTDYAVMGETDWTKLMRTMIADSKKADDIFLPGDYWRAHAADMVNIIDHTGIDSFRSGRAKPLNAFATGTLYRPLKFQNSKFWKAHDVLKSLPPFSILAQRYDQEMIKGYKAAQSQAHYKLRCIYALLQQTAPDLLQFDDPLIGHPLNFEIEGKAYSEVYLEKLLEFSLLREKLDFEQLESVVEVGGSYGLLASVILQNYPHIRYCFIDLAPVSAFAEYYLSARFPGEIESYYDTRDKSAIEFSPHDKRIKILCSHQILDINHKFDVFINTSSFQEMDRAQVEMYCKFAREHAKNVYLNNTQKAKLTGLTLTDYAKFLEPLSLSEKWGDVLYGGYRPALFQ